MSNQNFIRTVKQIRKIMPALAVILLITVYAVSAIAEGYFLSSLMAQAAGAWLAFAISVAIQATRALLVFFPQLNPNRPIFGYQGEVIAVVMGAIAIGSILGLVQAIGLAVPVAVSLAILMAAGIGVEIFFLREIRYSTELELYEDRGKWEELKGYYQSKEEFRHFLDSLKDFSPQASQPNPIQQQAPTQSSAAPTPPPAQSKPISKAFINALAATPGLTDEQMQKIWKWIDGGWPEDHVLDIVNQMAEENKQNAGPRPAPTTPDYYNGGKQLSTGDMYSLYSKYKNGGVPDNIKFTDEQLEQIRTKANDYGIDLSELFPATVPLDFSLNGNGQHH